MNTQKHKPQFQKFKKKDIPKLNYAMIHSQIGFSDGVSIVMKQLESVMTNNLKIPKKHIFYLVGKSKNNSKNIRQNELFWHKSKENLLANEHFNKGFGGELSEKIENAIKETKEEIKDFINQNKIDVIIAHNSSHPVNFIYSVALSRYYRDEIKKNEKTPKYILWWHDSHLERERYKTPSRDIKNYLLEGIPGKYVDYFIFINGLQFKEANKYFLEIDSRKPGFYKKSLKNHTIIYNTASIPINTLKDLQKNRYNKRTETFLEENKINKLLKNNNLKLEDTQFCLQHTRIVPRKRIDFALEYTYKLFSHLKKQNKTKAFFFIISGTSGDEGDNYKKDLIKLNKKLSKEYKTKKFFLIFTEDNKSQISFEEIPLIIAKLSGITTYFSEIEGFGNNLLEVLSAGLIPIVYTYPVFKEDISKYKFKTISLNKFEINPESIEETIKIIKNNQKRKDWANTNIKILKKKLSHRTIAPKLIRSIIRRR